MATRIYVGGLPYSTTDDQLLTLFNAYGEVTEATVAVDRQTARSKGFGFVQMPDDAAASTAIAQLDGHMMDGRSLRVNVAQPRSDRPRSDSDSHTRRW